MEDRIRGAVQKAFEEVGVPDTVAFTVERPTEMVHGDYATNAAMVGAKALRRNPKELAIELVDSLKSALGDSAERIEIAGPGFINITLARGEVVATTTEAAAKGEDWGRGKEEAGKRVAVEYSCPNPFKEMHIGHLMSTVIGESVARLIENSGATVIRDTYGGDIGPHVAKALWALQKDSTIDVANASEVDAAYACGSKAYEADVEAKQEIDALNVEIYKGENQALMDLWLKCREVCLEAFREIYRILDTKFDYYFFESEVAPIGMEVVRDGIKAGVFEESDDAVIYKGEKKGLHTLVFITSRGTPTYEAKDMGLAFLKEQRIQNDRIIIETGAEQVGHFKVFLAALAEVAPLVAAKMSHISHGLLTLTTGKMSSRLGNTITATDLLGDVVQRAQEKNEDPLVAEQVGVAALKYMILRQAAGGSIIFDPEKSLSLEGDSGPYLQYALVRAVKILSYESEGAGGVKEPEAPYAIERLILHYPEVAARAARLLAPHLLTTYLTELAGAWNAFYASHQVLGSPEEAYKQRVTRAFANTMTNGLHLLGIPAPERM